MPKKTLTQEIAQHERNIEKWCERHSLCHHLEKLHNEYLRTRDYEIAVRFNYHY